MEVDVTNTTFGPAQAAAALGSVLLYVDPTADPVPGQQFGLTVASDKSKRSALTTAGWPKARGHGLHEKRDYRVGKPGSGDINACLISGSFQMLTTRTRSFARRQVLVRALCSPSALTWHSPNATYPTRGNLGAIRLT